MIYNYFYAIRNDRNCRGLCRRSLRGAAGLSLPAQAETTPKIRPTPDQETGLEPLYRVIIHNDDVTPMDFVVRILARIFFVSGPAAVQIMYTAHYNGSAYVQTLPRGEAQNRIGRAHFAAALEGFPLRFTMEPE